MEEMKELHPDIVKFLSLCDTAMEDRLLTHRFTAHVSWNGQTGAATEGCLTGLAFGVWDGDIAGKRIVEFRARHGNANEVACRFDRWCDAYGVEVVGAAIRQQILDNRARRLPVPIVKEEAVSV